MTPIVLTLPGWQGSGPTHWQSRWEERYDCRRVEQDDWLHPSLDAWMPALDRVLNEETRPTILVAHSLGCALVAHWACAHRGNSSVRGALLVAPPDVDRESAPIEVRGFAPLPTTPLPFPALVVASTSDPYCSFLRAGLIASCWGAEFISVGNLGHINAESELDEWNAGWALLDRWR